MQTQFGGTIESSSANLQQEKGLYQLSAIKQLINVPSFGCLSGSLPRVLVPRAAVGLPEAAASSLFPGREREREKKKRTRHPWLVTVTNRGYYTSSKFFFPPEISQRTESGNCNWCEARAKIYSRTVEMSERKPLLIWSNNSKHNQKTQSLDSGWQSEHKRFHCPAALTNVAKNINQLWIMCVKRWFSL